MTATLSDVEELREAYREARAKIANFADPLERDVGLAALRLEATRTYRELVTTAVGLSDTSVAPLKEYVANLTGGERVTMSVDALDRGAESFAKKIFGDLAASLAVAQTVGVITVLADILLIAAVVGDHVGAFVFGVVLVGGGGLMFLLRSGQVVGPALESVWQRSWVWANTLGTYADAALEPARRAQAAVLAKSQAGGAALPWFTAKARTRSQLVMGAVWTAAAIAAVLVAIGVWKAATQWWDNHPGNPDNQPQQRQPFELNP